jgi:tetraacyldisaccharide 4'-kinase
VVVLSRADMLDADRRDHIRREVRRHAPEAAWAEVVQAPRTLLSSRGDQEPLESLQGMPVAAFCGIGNPAGFRHTLGQCGYRVVGFREFADHHNYGRADVESLADWAHGLDVAAVLCTHKDLVKLSVDQLGRRPLRAVTIGLEFLAGEGELESKLRALVPE